MFIIIRFDLSINVPVFRKMSKSVQKRKASLLRLLSERIVFLQILLLGELSYLVKIFSVNNMLDQF